MREIENIKYEIVLNRRERECQRRVAMAEFEKEFEMLNKFEKWAENIEKATSKQSDASKEIEKLADFILKNIEGEPSRNESAVDTAIRLLKGEKTPKEVD